MAADPGQLTILILLDLSTIFDTISHHIVFDSLVSIGIIDKPLTMLKSHFP